MVRSTPQHLRALAARVIAWLLFSGPVVVTTGRTRFVFDPRRGRLVPVMAGGAPDDEDSDEAEKDEESDDGAEEASEDDDKDDEGESGDTDWKRAYRRLERNSKGRVNAHRRAREAAEAALKEREDADKSEQDRAVEDAKKAGRDEALTEAQKERRADRLEVAVTRHAAKGVRVGEGDGARTVRFDDPADALVFIERDIASGDLDADDVFDDEGRVQTDALTAALVDLLERKPKLAADYVSAGGSGRGSGDPDTRKGRSAGKSLEDMSPDEHLKQIQSGR